MSAGIYLHIPFCISRCSYCDFATDILRDAASVQDYVDALTVEIEGFQSGVEADTIYFGGGTPSLLTPRQIGQVLAAVRSKFTIAPDAEITMEMNPATVTRESLRDFRSAGVNRASFGVQTFDDHALKVLARGHNADDAHKTFELLRAAGFDNVSFDLIAGLPGQSLGDWKLNLTEAIAMGPEHMSLYLLEVHSGTPLAEQIRSERQPRPDEELGAEMYEVMLDRLAGAGYEQYEISNFSRAGLESRHNSKYWLLEPVYGFGVSAHSFDGTHRYANTRDTSEFVAMINERGSAEQMREAVDVASEFVFLGLRMENGIDLDDYQQRFGKDLLAAYAEEITAITEAGLVHVTNGRLMLTRKGKLFSNEVFAVFV